MKGCINMLTLLTTKCGFRLPYHSSSAWSLCILQTSSRQIRARLTRLGLIGHALFCPQILSGRNGESEDFLHLCVGFLGVQWPSWKYYATATPGYSVSRTPTHFHSICTDQLQRVCSKSNTSRKCQRGLWCMLESAVKPWQSKFDISQSTGFVVHMHTICATQMIFWHHLVAFSLDNIFASLLQKDI